MTRRLVLTDAQSAGEYDASNPHFERHFTATQTVRDIVLGMADGLTVPFALAAGLSGAVDSTSLIVTAGVPSSAPGEERDGNRNTA